MKIIIASRSKAQKLNKEYLKSEIISITDIGSENPEFHGEDGGVLYLKFNDEEDGWLDTAPKPADVQKILRFAQRFRPDDTVIVHCEAGICRSSAVALGVYALHHGLEGAREAFSHYDGLIVPNGLLVRLMDEAMGLNGGLIALCEGFSKGWDATKGIY